MANTPDQPLIDFVHKEWERPVPPAIVSAASAIADRFADAALGVLFYGSCLRTGQIEDRILDFYIIVDDYAHAYDRTWLAKANALIPPNVFYHEMDVEGVMVRSKYAVVAIDDFERRCRPDCTNVSIWARFSQPCLLLQPRTPGVADRLARAVSDAMITMLASVWPLVPAGSGSAHLWTTAFDHTYGAELRSEKPGKGAELYALDQLRYDAATPLIIDAIGQPCGPTDAASVARARRRWRWRRWNGKVVSLARLIKASLTFDGGIDYLAWKIGRHSGVEVEVTDWMRRHPVLAGLKLFFSLRRRGAFR